MDHLTEAAHALFLSQGYVPTTLAQIAQRAGLATRTVYVRFGTKAALFRRVVDLALAGDAAPVDVAHRPRTRDAMSASTLAERIDALADVAVGIAERAGPLFEVAAQAEGIEPELAGAFDAGRRATRDLCTSFWQHAAEDRKVHDRIDLEQLAVVTDVLICADTVVHLQRTHAWSTTAHRSIIVDTLTAMTRSHPAQNRSGSSRSPAPSSAHRARQSSRRR